MANKDEKELREMGFWDKKFTYFSQVTGKMETFTVDGEGCGIFDEEAKKRFWSGKKTKVFSEEEETRKYNERNISLK